MAFYLILCIFVAVMIFYFSGTGNTRWAANCLAEALGDELRYIPDELRKGGELCYELKSDERLGFCFPTHGWQPPRIVREFIRKATFRYTSYVYALTTCGDNMGHAMRIFDKELFSSQGFRTDARFAVVMPESNVCFSFLHLDTDERARQKVEAAQERMKRICQLVTQRKKAEELVRGAIPYTYTYVIGGYYNKHLITDSKFWVDAEACIKCGRCSKLCPVDDIKGTPPVWLHNGRCTNCLACYHHCPAHAIHWAKMQRGQYYFNRRADQK